MSAENPDRFAHDGESLPLPTGPRSSLERMAWVMSGMPKVGRKSVDIHVYDELRAEVNALHEQIKNMTQQVAFLNEKLDATHTHRCFNCEGTVTEPTMVRQSTTLAARIAQEREAWAKDAKAAVRALVGWELVGRTLETKSPGVGFLVGRSDAESALDAAGSGR